MQHPRHCYNENHIIGIFISFNTNNPNIITSPSFIRRNKMRSASDYTVLCRVWLHMIRRSPPSMTRLDGLNWKVLIVSSIPEMTGLCYSGGKIVLSKTLIERFASDTEIQIFIAHEVFDDFALFLKFIMQF